MLCPDDKTKLRCIDSRPYDDGTVRRRYICPTCNKRLAGVEEIVGDWQDGRHTHYETREQFKERMLRQIAEAINV